MKVLVEIKYPYFATHKETVEVSIPDDAKGGNWIRDWIYEHETEILEEHGAEGDMSSAIEMGYAGVKLLKEEK